MQLSASQRRPSSGLSSLVFYSDAYNYTEVSATCFVANMSMPTITHDDNKTYTLPTIFHNIDIRVKKPGQGFDP